MLNVYVDLALYRYIHWVASSEIADLKVKV